MEILLPLYSHLYIKHVPLDHNCQSSIAIDRINMYSFYRAWLMHDAFQSTIGNPPDVLLQVGPTATQFAAHRAILISHSGYFKSVFTHQTSPIIVANVGAAEFTSLLTWMYTGFLDLNLENIYNILLATHLLHMPNALEICRNFLVQNNHLLHERVPNYVPPHNIIKPIASRKFVPETLRFEPIANNLELKPNENTSFDKIRPKSPEDDDKIIDIVKVNSPKPSTSFQRNTPSPVRSLSPNLSEKSDVIIQYKRKHTRKVPKPNPPPAPAKSKSDKVIIDIACCDGPVRFHRVLNNCYGLTPEPCEPETITQNKTDLMNKIMTESINNRDGNSASDSTDIVYTCVYCNHTFKSQYCYQKHARRHINPVTCKTEVALAPVSNETPASGSKREVKLLDMNVQYYPCKTCGSKFPSYYFVHKHRKMYHAEEMVGEKDVSELSSEPSEKIEEKSDVKIVNNEENEMQEN